MNRTHVPGCFICLYYLLFFHALLTMVKAALWQRSWNGCPYLVFMCPVFLSRIRGCVVKQHPEKTGLFASISAKMLSSSFGWVHYFLYYYLFLNYIGRYSLFLTHGKECSYLKKQFYFNFTMVKQSPCDSSILTLGNICSMNHNSQLHIHVYIYKHIYTCMHMYTYTHTCTHKLCTLLRWLSLGMLLHTCNANTWKAEAGGSPWFQEFKLSLSYTVRLCLQKAKAK